MRARLIDRRGTGARLLAVTAVVALVAGCSDTDPEQVEASQASPEPTIEPPPSSEPTEEPTESEPEPEEPEPTIGEDDPLYAPLPELEPDPENDVPDDIEQLILDAFEEAYENEMQMYAAAEVDEDALRQTHMGDGYRAIQSTVDHLREAGGRELSPDSDVTRVFVVEFASGSAVLRECATSGPRSGLYTADGNQLLEPAPAGEFARDRLLELSAWEEGEEPRYRVTDLDFGPREGC